MESGRILPGTEAAALAKGPADVRRIVSGGYCIGCGACAAVEGGRAAVAFDEHGMYQARFHRDMDPSEAERILKTCPFSEEGPNEDQLADGLFSNTPKDSRIGRYRGLYAGHVPEGDFRARGSSGGVVSWVLAELLQQNLADKIIHVAPDTRMPDRLFAYRVSTTLPEIMQGAKSRYYPVELSEVLDRVGAEAGRYALVGLPCFIKAVRRLALQHAAIRERIAFYVGLVCGHLKSKAFADCIAWQAGIAPGRLETIDFRVKLPGRPASDYGVAVHGDGIGKTAPASGYFGANWGYGLFKYSACEFCDDVFAETADISVGDAWLPDFTADAQGTSIVVTRSELMEGLIQTARREGRLAIQACSVEQMAESQAGGLRHRRDGLSCRLLLKREQGEWAPPKRVPVSDHGISTRRRKLYRVREVLRSQSHVLWLRSVRAGSFASFRHEMGRLIRRYHRIATPLPRRMAGKLLQTFRTLKQGIRSIKLRVFRGRKPPTGAVRRG